MSFLEHVRDKWLNQCGYCDAGLAMDCTCPEGDFRSDMLKLVQEIDRLRTREHIVDVPARHMKDIREWLEVPNGSITAGRVTFEAVEGGGILVRTRPHLF